MSDTFYVKKGNKYIPVGMSGPDLWDGIWLVQSFPGSRSSKNLALRLCDLPDCRDLQILAKVTMLEEIIMKTLSDAWDNGKSTSFSEVAQRIVGKLAQLEGSLTTKNMRG